MNAQLAFDPRALTPDTAHDMLTSALVWIDENPGAWSLIVEWAHRDADRYGLVRVKRYIEDIRMSPLAARPNARGPKIANANAAAFGRILAAWYEELAPFVPLQSSKLDGCVIPPKR